MPGPVKDNGEVLELPNLGLGYFNIIEEMSAMTGLKVRAGNDANVAALGEQWKEGIYEYGDDNSTGKGRIIRKYSCIYGTEK